MPTGKKKFKESARSKADRLDPKVAKKKKKYVKAAKKSSAKPTKRNLKKTSKAANKVISTVGKRAKKYKS